MESNDSSFDFNVFINAEKHLSPGGNSDFILVSHNHSQEFKFFTHQKLMLKDS